MIYAETTRLILRDWIKDDIEPFAQINADAQVMKYFPKTLTATESYGFYKRITNEFVNKGFGLYAVTLKATGEFIGYVGLHTIGIETDFTPGIEIGWRLRSDCHRHGFAPEAARAVLHLAKRQGLTELYSFTSTINIPSQKVMIKIGMHKVKEFNHPLLPPHSPLTPHVLYQINL